MKTAEAAVYFQAHYILWVVGKLEPEVCEELDSMTPPGGENWKQLMERICPMPRAQIQRHFTALCELLSDEEALDVLFMELGFEKAEAPDVAETT